MPRYKEKLISLFEMVEGDDFLPMIVQTVDNKRWPNTDGIGGLVRDYTVHSKEDKSIESLCERVMQLVERASPRSVPLDCRVRQGFQAPRVKRT